MSLRNSYEDELDHAKLQAATSTRTFNRGGVCPGCGWPNGRCVCPGSLERAVREVYGEGLEEPKDG